MRMSKPKSFFRVFTESGPLIVLAVAVALLVGIVGPASAQFFNFGGPPRPPQPLLQQPRSGGFGGGWFGGDLFAPFQQQQQQQQPKREVFSKAPPPEKRETVPERNVLVLGDAMADWLAYGLEDAYSEQPDMGVIRKHKTVSGLIKYQPKGDPADWAAAAKGILAAEKPDAIVVMLGLNDRMAMREPAAEKSDGKSSDKKGDKKDARAKPADPKSGAKTDGANDAAAKPEDKPVDTELSPDDAADNSDAPPIIAPEKSARSPNGLYEFREERWVELYTRKIEEMIGVMKSKGVPVLWVGLPAVRGAKATSDMLFLDALYRDAAGKAGITYVDVWDGFVDEAGRFLQQGPDFEGQIRRLRSYDGVYFHQARRAQARALCRARDHAAVGRAFRTDRTADRTGNPRRQCAARSARTTSAGGTDPAAGGILGRHRSIARRSGIAPGRGRCAGRANAGQGRTAGAASRPRR